MSNRSIPSPSRSSAMTRNSVHKLLSAQPERCPLRQVPARQDSQDRIDGGMHDRLGCVENCLRGTSPERSKSGQAKLKQLTSTNFHRPAISAEPTTKYTSVATNAATSTMALQNIAMRSRRVCADSPGRFQGARAVEEQ